MCTVGLTATTATQYAFLKAEPLLCLHLQQIMGMPNVGSVHPLVVCSSQLPHRNNHFYVSQGTIKGGKHGPWPPWSVVGSPKSTRRVLGKRSDSGVGKGGHSFLSFP